MKWSSRTGWELEENAFAAAVRAAGDGLLDLTVSNPTVCGFEYEADRILAALADPAALRYVPDPLGITSARGAVAEYYRDHGAEIPLGHLCLTTSTSEAYSFLFRLLCDAGDEVLIAQPGYPLFDYIAGLDDVRLREFPLLYDPSADVDCFGAGAHGWSIDFDALEAAISERTRALVVVHPNNPTGHFVFGRERARLETVCAARGLALIVDEVFLDYALGTEPPRSFLAPPAPEDDLPEQARPLCFVLSGLSKVAALPQMKVSWIAVTGPGSLVDESMARLEVIADTYLSMNAPVQWALPQWLGLRGTIQQQIRARLRANLATLDARLRGSSAQRLAMQGGWTAVLRVPRTVDGIDFAYAALAHGTVVQPGEFYGLPPGRVVLSLLTPPDLWARGLARLPI